MSRKKRKKHPADRPATRRYVQSMVRRLKAEMLRAQEAEIRAALPTEFLGSPFEPPYTFYLQPPGGGSLTKTKRSVNG